MKKLSGENYDLQISIAQKKRRKTPTWREGAHTRSYTSFSSGLFASKITLVAMNGHNCVFVHLVWFFSPVDTVHSTASK